tara:strand:+ start:2216 stop:5218 length:3003 start_codon:yes stop_codon:yes gene_type:complete
MNITQGNDYLKFNDDKLKDTKTVSNELLDSSDKTIVEGFSSCKKTQKYPSNIPDGSIEKNPDGSNSGYELGDESLDAEQMNNEDYGRYNQLTNELLRLLAIYKEIHGELVEATDEYLSDRDVDKNVYAGFTGDLQEKPKYIGCYRDSWNRAIPNLQRIGPYAYAFNVERCAQRAWDKGHTVFGLQHIQGNDPKRTTCWTGTDMNRAKKYGIGIDYRWTWATVQRLGFRYNGSSDTKLHLFPEGVFIAYTGPEANGVDDFRPSPRWQWWSGWAPGWYGKDGRNVYGQSNTDKFSFYRWWWWWHRRWWGQYYGGGRVNYLDRHWVGRDFWWTGLSAIAFYRPRWYLTNYWMRTSGSKAQRERFNWRKNDKRTKWTPTESSSNSYDTRNLDNIPIKCDDGRALQGYKLEMKYGRVQTLGYSRRNSFDHGGNDYGFFNWTPDQCKSWCDKRRNCRGFNIRRSQGRGCWIKYGLSRGGRTGTWDFYYKRTGRKNYMRYWYRCRKWDGSLQCKQKATRWNDSGRGNSIYMDRHHFHCQENEVINKVEMENSTDANRTKYRFHYTCCRNTNTRGCFMIMQDDGNLVIYLGSGPQDKGKVLWASGTNGQVGNIKMQEWIEKRKNGRSYLRSGEFLKRGEYIASDNGMMRAQLQTNGNFVVRRAISRCGKYSDGYTYGRGWGNAVYTIPKNNVDDLNKAVYIDKDQNAFKIPDNMLKGGMSFTKLENQNTFGHNLRHFRIKNSGARYGEYDCQAYVDRYQDLQRAFGPSCESPSTRQKAKNHWERNGQREGRLAGKDDADPYECKKACIEDDRCGSFVMGGNLCVLKNENSYPKGDKFSDKNADLYIRSKDADNDSSCVSDVEAVSSSKYSEMMKEVKNGGKPSGTMNRNTACGLKRSTRDERNNLLERGQAVKLKIDEILSEMDSLTKVAQFYMAKKPEMKKKVNDMMEDYNRSFKKIKKYKKTKNLLTQYEENTDLLMSSNNYKYVLWSVGAIVALIAVIQFMKKRS